MEDNTNKKDKEKKKNKPWDVEYDENVFADIWPVEVDLDTLEELKKAAGKLQHSRYKDLRKGGTKLEDQAMQLEKILKEKKKKI